MMKKIYSCDICRDEKSVGQLIGCNFSNMTKFKLDTPRSTDGTHICKDCLQQIVDQAWSVGISINNQQETR